MKQALGVLVYDNRNFGDSDGQPRQEVDPLAQIRDYRRAITYASSLPEVDADRIGIWGTSYTGGHVLAVAAMDKRVKCVVSQVPVVSGYRNFHRAIREDLVPDLLVAAGRGGAAPASAGAGPGPGSGHGDNRRGAGRSAGDPR